MSECFLQHQRIVSQVQYVHTPRTNVFDALERLGRTLKHSKGSREFIVIDIETASSN